MVAVVIVAMGTTSLSGETPSAASTRDKFSKRKRIDALRSGERARSGYRNKCGATLTGGNSVKNFLSGEAKITSLGKHNLVGNRGR